MIRRSDITVFADGVTPEPGVYVTVKDDTGALATLYDDAAASKANPFTSDAVTGAFYYNIADADAGGFIEEYRLSLSDSPRTVRAVYLSVMGATGPPGATGPAGDVAKVADRTELAAIVGMAAGATRYLVEAGREGTFVFSTTNLSVKVTADPNQGEYVAPASAPTGASGAWVRTNDLTPNSNASYNGNSSNTDHGLSLVKIRDVLQPGAYAHSFSIVEGPMVWWDDADGYYHMVFAAYSAAPVASIGHAKSLDLVNWTQDATALFSASGTGGAPDENGTTGPYIVKKSGTYYLFYIGLTAAGYEGGEKSICLATAASLAGPWTRRGAVISKGAVGGATDWRSSAVWHPCVVQRGGAYYMFFNATGSDAKERIGYATSPDLLTWTVKDSASPVIGVGSGGTWNSSISGDPSVYRDGDYWFMDFYGFNGAVAADGIAWTTDANFPGGWTQHPGNPILAPAAWGYDSVYAHKPFVFFKGGDKFHFYTALGDTAVRCIALAAGERSSDLRRYVDMRAASTYRQYRIAAGSYGVLWKAGASGKAQYEFIYDAVTGTLKLERTSEAGQTAAILWDVQDTCFKQVADGGTYLQTKIQPCSGNKAMVMQLAPSGTANAVVWELYAASNFSTATRQVIKNNNGTLEIGGDAAALPIKFMSNGAGVLSINGAPGNYANDAAAAAGGVPVNGIYRNGSILMMRVA